jgi:hypothetical protein
METNELEKTRPGRKLGAEKRRVARSYLREFYETEAFLQVPQKYRLAILELCPIKDSHTMRQPQMDSYWEESTPQHKLSQDSLLRA